MALFALRRLLLSIPLLIGITFVSYVVISLAPGGPLDFLTPEDPNASPEVKERLIKEFGLDRPIHVQYWEWLKRAVRLDFGRSFLPDGRPVLVKIGERLPVTLFLNLIEMAIIVGLAVPIGVLSATRQYSLYDKITTIFVFVGFATPDFWLALLLMILFGVQLGWLPASGYVSPFEDLKGNLAAMIMPAFVLGNAIAAVLMRHTRSAMLQVLSSDYVRTARAKGLDERVVVLKHALRNALTPVITLGALEFGTLLSGAVLTEQVFTIPGFGKLIVDAVFNRDYAVVQGVVLFTATAYIVLNLLADIAYFAVNPRMRS